MIPNQGEDELGIEADTAVQGHPTTRTMDRGGGKRRCGEWLGGFVESWRLQVILEASFPLYSRSLLSYSRSLLSYSRSLLSYSRSLLSYRLIVGLSLSILP